MLQSTICTNLHCGNYSIRRECYKLTHPIEVEKESSAFPAVIFGLIQRVAIGMKSEGVNVKYDSLCTLIVLRRKTECLQLNTAYAIIVEQIH